MYRLNIVDNNNVVFEVVSFQKEADMDSFTSYFENEKELLKLVGLDRTTLGSNIDLFRVEVKNVDKNKDKDMCFIGKIDRGIVDFSNDNQKRNDFVKKVSECDKKTLLDFFYQELIFRYNNETNSAESIKLDNIINFLEYDAELEDYQKNLRIKLNNYLLNHGKPVYSEYKRIYRYLSALREVDKESIDLTDKEKKDKTKIVFDVRNRLSEVLFNNNSFVIKKGITYQLETQREIDIYDDYPTGYYAILPEDYEDIEDYRTALGLFADENGMSEEEKYDFIKKNMKKYTK